MKGIDTSVLVAYLVQDTPTESRLASRFIRSACTSDDPCWINRIVLCELVWVLETTYGYPRQRIAEVLERILRTKQFRVEDLSACWVALRAYVESGADFADVLQGEVNLDAGCQYSVTLDKIAARLRSFTGLA